MSEETKAIIGAIKILSVILDGHLSESWEHLPRKVVWRARHYLESQLAERIGLEAK